MATDYINRKEALEAALEQLQFLIEYYDREKQK